VMPQAFGGYIAEGGAFRILRFAEPDLPDMVYLEYLTNAIYLDKPAEVDRYAKVMGRLTVDSMPPDQSVEWLARIITEM